MFHTERRGVGELMRVVAAPSERERTRSGSSARTTRSGCGSPRPGARTGRTTRATAAPTGTSARRPWTRRPRGAGLVAFNRGGASTDLDVAFDHFRVSSHGDPVPATYVGAPDLGIQAPNAIKVKAGKKVAKVPFKVRNSGDGDSGPVELCVKAPKKKLKLKGAKCVTREIPAGETAERKVKLKVKPKARGKTTKVKLSARGPDVATQRATVRVRVGK